MSDLQTNLENSSTEEKQRTEELNNSEVQRERDELDDLFDDFVSKKSIFINKDVLSIRHVP